MGTRPEARVLAASPSAATIAPAHTRTIMECGACSAMICPHGLCRQCGACKQCEANLQLLDRQGKPSKWAKSAEPTMAEMLNQADQGEAAYGRAVRMVEAPEPLFVSQIRLNVRQLSRNRQDIAARAENFAEWGIPRDDWAEASDALDELLSDCCRCGNRKQPHNTFCPDCYRHVPSQMRDGLKKHLSHGYLDAYRTACLWLDCQAAYQAHGVDGVTAPIYYDPARDTEGPREEPEIMEPENGPLEEPEILEPKNGPLELAGHSPVVWLSGVSGCVCLSHVEPIIENGGPR